MKPKRMMLVALAIVTSMGFKNADTLTDAERKYALEILEQTQENLLEKVKGLTPAQLNFKADASSWSIAECVEHIAITEKSLFDYAQMALKEPSDPSKREEVSMTDEAVVSMITDRSTKTKAAEPVQPTGKFGTFEATLKEFKTRRAKSIKYIKTTSDDLRNHYNDFGFAKFDAYQTILFMAGHSKRHTAQIEEIMAHEDFPKK